MEWKPVGEHVVIEVDEAKTQSEGGIFLPSGRDEKNRLGTVVAVGPGEWFDTGSRHPMEVKVGDRVITSIYSGTSVTDGGKTFCILSQDDILSVVDDK